MRRTAGETKNRSATLGASEATLDHLIQKIYLVAPFRKEGRGQAKLYVRHPPPRYQMSSSAVVYSICFSCIKDTVCTQLFINN